MFFTPVVERQEGYYFKNKAVGQPCPGTKVYLESIWGSCIIKNKNEPSEMLFLKEHVHSSLLPDKKIQLLRGLDNAGKTTILKRFNGEDINLISPTLGFNIKTLEHRGYKLNIWDVGGQKSLRSYWRNYFECTDGLVWVVDSADKRRLDNCKAELHQLLAEERLAGATLLVFCNKQDLPGALSSDAVKNVLELDNIKTHHWNVLHCSAVTGLNLLTGMDWLIDDISARIFTLD